VRRNRFRPTIAAGSASSRFSSHKATLTSTSTMAVTGAKTTPSCFDRLARFITTTTARKATAIYHSVVSNAEDSEANGPRPTLATAVADITESKTIDIAATLDSASAACLRGGHLG
jgi:hypothetical protein